MIEVLRTARGLWRRLSLYFSTHCILGTAAFVSLLVISYHDFLVLFDPFS
jgi:hypothetical protein